MIAFNFYFASDYTILAINNIDYIHFVNFLSNYKSFRLVDLSIKNNLKIEIDVLNFKYILKI